MTLVEAEAKPRKSLFALKSAQTILGELDAAIGDHAPKSSAARAAVLAHIRETLAQARKQAEAELIASGKGVRCAQNLSNAQDEIITAVHMFATRRVYPVDNPSGAEAIALSAVGGYGRGTLAPGSDIDLLFILPYKQTPWGEQVTEYILYMLWDLGQKVGHAVRSVDECIRMASADMTVRTATLEARFVAGDKDLFRQLVHRFETEIMPRTGPEFIAAKMAERDERHKVMGNTRYVVEPNIKDGKGGLRDLNTLFWIGKYFYQVKTSNELVGKGVLSASEYRIFTRADDFLWAVRCHLHFLTGRAEEKLTFDMQPELAERMGYAQRVGMLGVERFMKRYFLVAKDVGDLTRIICASLEFNHAKDMDLVGRVLAPFRPGRSKIKGETDFVLDTGRLNIASPDVFENDPVNLIRMFLVAGREQLLFHPDAIKRISRSLRLIDRKVRTDPRANGYFLTILTSPKSVERILRQMNESGVLGKFVPEFGKIVALMQFNMYHHYTVDEHLIRSIGVMADIANGGLADQLPLTHELLPQLNDTRLLYVALFLHDIAKGRPEDHSIAGARIARRFCPRLGLSAAETDTVSWLIEYHLLMSEIAQARDIQDPETAKAFADVVQSPQRLALLMILTACDIRAVGPGVWTGWKGSLLRALYYATEPLLSGGHSQVTQSDRINQARAELADSLKAWPTEEVQTYVARHYDHYWLRAEPELQVEHARMIRLADKTDEAFAGSIRIKAFESITEVSFYTPDHPRLLSLIAGACTMQDASIIGAQIFSTRDGRAIDTFRLRRAFTSDEDEKVRATRIIDTVKQLLQGKRNILIDLGKDSRLNRRLKPFALPTQVTVSNALSEKFTVIEVSGLDRTGLLHALTHQIADLNLTIGSAHIGTYGEKAVDVFYVTDLIGQKITSKPRQRKIHDSLMAVFHPKLEAKPNNG
ncbi:[protein-PII] uridylyltransferase [Devosia sp. J2-20]|uniref:Bifunctional uridylyltransferase/uridylyl-removing enzyme n=2 Tax=Devosia TaxID=46913 RepID=A0A942I790_9HYPH|nr:MULTISPECIES: [protein-PII] uridylyltransferase [Devosia]MBS3850432.1 [protein-PII] uridylyltransferase [Devosia litorisediminis]MCZ4347478.1 [protein-PII] uridylyltransferase [Devosia neptuniae]WDR00182.1 [protein-PII] uridylyltransferase [Devosia sp. J2-20]|tara:strand:- start:12064 stop:14859 length:2796 start_codon:yes stop_codon:yes gene_type:complete